MPVLKDLGEQYVALGEMKKRAARRATPPKDVKLLANEGANETERFTNSQGKPKPKRGRRVRH